MTFAELARVGTVAIGDEPGSSSPICAFRLRRDGSSWPAPPPRPTATPASRSHGTTSALQHGRLRLLTPASAWSLNDMFANEPKLSRRRGPATVTLHPADAADRGLAQGDRVRLANETAELELQLALSELISPRRGLFAQRPLAWPRGHGRQRQRAQPGHPVRHRCLDQRARHRGDRHASRLSRRARRPSLVGFRAVRPFLWRSRTAGKRSGVRCSMSSVRGPLGRPGWRIG